MSGSEMQRLASDYAADNDLRNGIDGAGSLDAATAYVRERGYDVTHEDARVYFQAHNASGDAELDDRQLEMVSGGKGAGGPGVAGSYLLCSPTGKG